MKLTGNALKVIRNAFIEAVAPTEFRCLMCGKDVFDEIGFCSDCIKTVVFNNGKTCVRCGVGIDSAEDYCNNCAFDKLYFDKSYAVFSYEGAIRHAILQMKFNSCGQYAKVFARYLAFFAVKNNLQFDAVCFPPMSRNSKRQRFYNQSQLLAEYFCDIMDRNECYLDALTKIKETERQERLSKDERKHNLIGAYKVTADVKGKRVLVIDDVQTTGSTLNECAKVLKKAGAVSVTGLMVSARKEFIPFETT
ncbi:MAG: ComF family protein [Clostridia bacterium]|nr:ComF family protein [Clostridia bacterium]